MPLFLLKPHRHSHSVLFTAYTVSIRRSQVFRNGNSTLPLSHTFPWFSPLEAFIAKTRYVFLNGKVRLPSGRFPKSYSFCCCIFREHRLPYLYLKVPRFIIAPTITNVPKSCVLSTKFFNRIPFSFNQVLTLVKEREKSAPKNEVLQLLCDHIFHCPSRRPSRRLQQRLPYHCGWLPERLRTSPIRCVSVRLLQLWLLDQRG
jgi:hypothetical protein